MRLSRGYLQAIGLATRSEKAWQQNQGCSHRKRAIIVLPTKNCFCKTILELG